MKKKKAAVLSIALSCALLGAAPASAGAAGGASLFGAKRIADRALASQSGGADTTGSDTRLHGVVADNRAANAATGANQIGGGAFTGTSGIPVVIQNTGNNVLIQSATIVNVQVK